MADDSLRLSAAAQEGVELLQAAAERGDPEHYQAVQRLLLSETDKAGPEGSNADLLPQTPAPLPNNGAG